MDLEPREDDVTEGDGEESDSASGRSRTLIFLVAAGFLIVGGLSLSAYMLDCRRHHLELSVWHCVYLSIPLVIGMVILVLSPALARAIDEFLDE